MRVILSHRIARGLAEVVKISLPRAGQLKLKVCAKSSRARDQKTSVCAVSVTEFIHCIFQSSPCPEFV